MRFTLRQFEVFVATARLGNISAAADELAMSQSAASAALAELERRSGHPLFDRVGKRLRINELGRTCCPWRSSWSSERSTSTGCLRAAADLAS